MNRPLKLVLGILILLLLFGLLLVRCEQEEGDEEPLIEPEEELVVTPAPIEVPEEITEDPSWKTNSRSIMESLGSGVGKLKDGIASKTELTEEDILRYISAYNKIAEISLQLEESRSKSDSLSIFTCKESRAQLEKVLQDAGYSGLASFLMMDMRIHYTVQAVAYVQITELLSDAASGITAEELVADPKRMSELKQGDHKSLSLLCGRVSTLQIHIKNIGAMFKKWAEAALNKGDLALVDKHFDDIFSAWEHSGLPSELKHTGGSHDWDDWD